MSRRLLGPVIAAASATVLLVASAAAHDLFLRPRDFFATPGRTVDVRVLNGTFTTSEATVTPDRVRDLTVASPRGLRHPDRADWSASGKESGWRVLVDGPGTHLLGASLHERTIRLSGTSFTGYLREEALDDVIDARRRERQSADSVHERYGKHVKALVRAGTASSIPASGDTAFRAVLGYPAELVPLDDPYRVPFRGTMRIRALVDGQATANLSVLVGGRTPSGARLPRRVLRSDASGLVRVRLDQRGTWYVKFIEMRRVPASARDSVDYESRWATLTFARP
ncbi:MAG: hypothetical protein JWL60_2554 [Gemmatimonadetes bacterium]|jgi:uncharacterized GH25 family protein|nr:hypothetical protein [Gemmatimonadota bacterium]